jgi:hypothetical protein
LPRKINEIFIFWNGACHRKKLVNHFKRNIDGILPIFAQIPDPIKEVEPEPSSASYQAQNQLKIANKQKMINEIMGFNPNDFVIPRLTMRYKKKIMSGLTNLFNHLLNFYLPLSKNELDTEYFEVFSE